LFASLGYDLRELMRDRAATDAQLASSVANIWNRRDDRYSELRASLSPDANAKTQRVEMSYIGG
jgi:cyclic pyranopterin phosphate synthase